MAQSPERNLPSDEKPPVAVGMSGGADSTLAAYRLQQAGFPVVGITLRLWQDPDQPALEAGIARARAAAARLGLRHELVDLRPAFRERIVAPFIAAYARGLTPSPCVRCNVLVKFGLMLEAARALGCEFLATGHYARRQPDAFGRPTLWRGVDRGKDQSYFLAGLRPAQLARAVWPLGELTKAEVVAAGQGLGLIPRGLGESQDLCFIPDGDYVAFLRRQAPELLTGPGPILDTQGRVLGRHDGTYRFTLGQRRGLGLGGGPWYVLRTDWQQHVVVVGSLAETVSKEVWLEEVNWLSEPPADGAWSGISAQIRSSMTPVAATLQVEAEGRVRLSFDAPVSAVTPGQFAVVYRGDQVLAGGWIRTAPGGAL